MTLKGPIKKDLQKLHAEVNQLVNQRFILTTLAVTIFGVIEAWVIPKDFPPSKALNSFLFAVSGLLQVLLFGLFLFSHHLSGMIRKITTYLIITEQSGWELDWRKFRKKPYIGYTKAQAFIFLTLGVLATAIPFVLSNVFEFKLEPIGFVLFVIIFGLFYVASVVGMSFFNRSHAEKSSEQRWHQLSKNDDKKQ